MYQPATDPEDSSDVHEPFRENTFGNMSDYDGADLGNDDDSEPLFFVEEELGELVDEDQDPALYDPGADEEIPGPILASLPALGEGRPSAQILSELIQGSRMIVVVDIEGVHDVPIVFCGCPNASREDIQLLELGLYPASKLRPRTAFTLRALDDFLLSNKVCNSTPRQYFNKLRRTTNAAFPHSVPVRLRCCFARPLSESPFTHSTLRIDTRSCSVSPGNGVT